MEYVISVDQGTTSTRAILFNRKGKPVPNCIVSLGHETIRQHPGWEEHNPVEILNNVKKCIDDCVAKAQSEHSIDKSQVKAVGITNQRETTVVWDRDTGTPLYNAIVWQDSRTHHTADELRQHPTASQVRERTGLNISTYFSGVKLRWLIDNEEPVRKAVSNGTAKFGTIDSWLVWNLAEGHPHLTDVTNAGRTMMMNIRNLEWDDVMLDLIGVSTNILPEIKSCSEEFGKMSCTKLKGVPISGVIGDQQSALVGQSCFEVGEAKSTYGTGCFLIVNTGLELKMSDSRLLTTPAYKIGDEPCIYSLEGSIGVAGSSITWMQDQMHMIQSPAETEEIARSVPDTGDVYIVPAFTGLFAPWWREDARGTVVGMTQYTSRAHFVRAVLESIAFQVNDVLQAASEDMGEPISELRVDGGVTQNSLAMQMQADITGVSVVRPEVIETTALGAAFCAGHAVGLFQSLQEFRDGWQLDTRFTPEITENKRAEKLQRWKMAIQRSFGWDIEIGSNDAEAENPTAPSGRSMLAKITSREFLTGLGLGVGAAVLTFKIIHRSVHK